MWLFFFFVLVATGLTWIVASSPSIQASGQPTTRKLWNTTNEYAPSIRPMWKAPWEKPLLGRSLQQEAVGESLPDNLEIRYPAEFEPVASVLFSFQYFREETLDIAQKLNDHTNVDIFMVNGPENLFSDDDDSSYISLPFDSESVWTRDYGPVGVLVRDKEDNATDVSLALINMRYRRYLERPGDNALPCKMSNLFNDWTCYELDLIIDGGNLMSDGQGNLFTTTRTYDWNPDFTPDQVDALLKRYFGVHTIHALAYAKTFQGQPLDGTGHIDMFAKIVDPCKVIVAQTNSSVFDEITQAAADFFSNLECISQAGETSTYKVFRTKAWAEASYFNTFTVWYTYTNSLIANNVIIIPGYKDGVDEQAVSVYQAASPDRIILQSNTDSPIQYGGSVHCMTRQLPVAVNSPSRSGFSSCKTVEFPSCDLYFVSNFCWDLHSSLLLASSQEECSWNDVYFEYMCCTKAAERTLVLPGPYEANQETRTIRIVLSLDEHPTDTAWVISNSTGDTVAASPFYNSSFVDATVQVDVELETGETYTFSLLDGSGDGIDACCQYAEDLITGESLFQIRENFGLYLTKELFLVTETKLTGNPDEPTFTPVGERGKEQATSPIVAATQPPVPSVKPVSSASPAGTVSLPPPTANGELLINPSGAHHLWVKAALYASIFGGSLHLTLSGFLAF